jgi:hypothetical protein
MKVTERIRGSYSVPIGLVVVLSISAEKTFSHEKTDWDPGDHTYQMLAQK